MANAEFNKDPFIRRGHLDLLKYLLTLTPAETAFDGVSPDEKKALLEKTIVHSLQFLYGSDQIKARLERVSEFAVSAQDPVVRKIAISYILPDVIAGVSTSRLRLINQGALNQPADGTKSEEDRKRLINRNDKLFAEIFFTLKQAALRDEDPEVRRSAISRFSQFSNAAFGLYGFGSQEIKQTFSDAIISALLQSAENESNPLNALTAYQTAWEICTSGRDFVGEDMLTALRNYTFTFLNDPKNIEPAIKLAFGVVERVIPKHELLNEVQSVFCPELFRTLLATAKKAAIDGNLAPKNLFVKSLQTFLSNPNTIQNGTAQLYLAGLLGFPSDIS